MTILSVPARIGVLRYFLAAVCWSLLCLAVPEMQAGDLSSLDIPPELARWKPWVLYGMDDKLCPARCNDAETSACVWPSRLNLTIADTSGHFEQQWLVFKDAWIVLPGNREIYPDGVELDGRKVPVLPRDAGPSIRLTKGEHRVTGNFSWKEIPETMMIPPESGIVSLTVKGQSVEQPVMDASGRLWIRKRDAGPAVENRLDIRIFRRIQDDIPLTVLNHIRMNISGQVREVRLKDILLKDAVPLRLSSSLPARIGPDGEVMIQARPGNWLLEIDTRFDHPIDRIAAGSCPYGEEIWSFEARNHLRMVTVSGAPAIDPGQTEVPAEWKTFPAYRIQPDTVLQFQTLRRGDSDPAPDQLNIHRTWWLDFDGQGFTQKDILTGTLSRQWYLTLRPPGILGKAAVDGVDQLITAHGAEHRAGVELRQGQLNLEGHSRIEGPLRRIPAAGWDHGFQSAAGELHLPPGWHLLAASGVEVSPASWVERWSLLDFFLVLLTTIVVGRLHSYIWGAVALITLTLTFQEPGAPQTIWLSLLAASALIRVLPDGKMKQSAVLWRACSAIVLLIIVLPYSVQAIRQGLYPQLERILDRPHYAGGMPSQNLMAPAPAELQKKERRLKADAALPMSPGKVLYESVYNRPTQIQDPQALIQTGPGLPTWRWRMFTLQWNGPVDMHQTFRLWLIPPWMNLLLAVIRVLLLAVLTAGLCSFTHWRSRFRFKASTAAASLLFLFITTASVKASSDVPLAAYPPPPMLEALQQRLLKKPDCFPVCADIPRMDIRGDETALDMTLDIQAAVETAVPLPGGAENWRPDTVTLNQQPLKGLMKDREGRVWALMPEGTHQVRISGKTARLNTIQIALPIKPRRVTAAVKGWSVQGIGPEGQVSGGIQLQRIEKQETPGFSVGIGAVQPFFQVERELILGLTWEIQTRITRLTPVGAPLSLALPLLTGESLTTAGILVEGGKALINFDPDSREMSLLSHLDITDTLQLTAPESVPWTETWILDAGTVWHCDFSGIPVIHQQDDEGKWRPEWRPWPGERVDIRIARPPVVPGPIITVDGTTVKWTPGENQDKAELTLTIRTSRGGQHLLELPAHAVLQKVTIQGRSQPIRQEGRSVVLPLIPGSQTIALEWQQPGTGLWRYHPAQVSIGTPAVNAGVTFHLPEHRWILWASGPRLGPAVLFWGYLLIVVLISIGLGQTSLAPLKTYQWLLLTVGLTQIPSWMALVVVGWLLILGVRSKTVPSGGWLAFNFTQLILIGWTVAAMSALYSAVENGLLGIPDMQIAGNQSTSRMLNWTQDRIDGLMPAPWVISLPEWVFHILMLCWSLWLAFSLLRWLKWGWQCFSQGGAWKKSEPRRKKEPPAAAPATEA